MENQVLLRAAPATPFRRPSAHSHRRNLLYIALYGGGGGGGGVQTRTHIRHDDDDDATFTTIRVFCSSSSSPTRCYLHGHPIFVVVVITLVIIVVVDGVTPGVRDDRAPGWNARRSGRPHRPGSSRPHGKRTQLANLLEESGGRHSRVVQMRAFFVSCIRRVERTKVFLTFFFFSLMRCPGVHAVHAVVVQMLPRGDR